MYALRNVYRDSDWIHYYNYLANDGSILFKGRTNPAETVFIASDEYVFSIDDQPVFINDHVEGTDSEGKVATFLVMFDRTRQVVLRRLMFGDAEELPLDEVNVTSLKGNSYETVF